MKKDLQFYNADQEPVAYNGEPLQWRVSAYAIVIQNDQLLIIKNKNEKPFDIPGGGVEFGETLEEALTREALEEAGAQIEILNLIHHHMGFFYHRERKAYFQTLQLFYRAKLKGVLITPTEPAITMAKFVPLSDLGKYPLPIAVMKAITLL